MPIRRRVVVDGRVQGVFFRDSCRQEATVAGVAGWVRNLRDGRVEAAFEGAPDAVERMVQWCRTGPPRATVIGIEVHVEEPAGHPGFRVRD